MPHDNDRALPSSRHRPTFQPNHRPLPLQQGYLDSLCGIYTAINAIALLLPKSRRRLHDKLFTVLLDTIEADEGIDTVIREGIGFRLEADLLDAAARYLHRQLGLALHSRPLFDPRQRLPIDAVFERIGGVTTNGGVVIAALLGRVRHWSVITRLTDRSILFHDSAGLTRLHRRRCRMDHEPPKTANDYVLKPGGLLAINVKEPSGSVVSITHRTSVASNKLRFSTANLEMRLLQQEPVAA
ncbi:MULTISPECIES: hypothetical protein [unclassified Chelatococcus]|uniref:hypothetical protein n=1 Tax=unclassified Chelatococcus TaxID=2638111 RepID=UPI001BCBA5B5|nr:MULTISPECIES: hypothetical protein [unclassified Chelatococcus]CAH1654857.1 hypothetical protein CHELA41_20976 [Hyphomicrobiales bacterium]MBS7740306.1 hypothetical protein [Chelatococcus sp. HY11]MBX3544864.1 hypothetical protein [Chelatococcus sp.]MCO5078453.1 hypothetical protein [Chelatococcus sp.]CAH1685290.1 hypothetical protein CHELA20_53951 [Hyphomicrobiales bacterium]